jgi:hypothetical protein
LVAAVLVTFVAASYDGNYFLVVAYYVGTF